MAKERGWWSLSCTVEPDEADLDHIAQLIQDGFTEGEIVGGDPEDEDDEADA